MLAMSHLNGARPVRVAIVNDYEIVIAGIAALLAPFADRIEVIERDGQMPVVSDVDVILYDTFGQVQGDGVDLPRLVSGGSAKVIIFSWNTERGLVSRAMALGARGYLSKSADAAEVVAVIERVHAGERVVPRSDAVDGAGAERGGWPGKAQGLTAREAEVIALITQGLSNQEIADKCYLSINSVKTYIRTAYRKMDVARRSQAVLWGLSHGFEPDQFRAIDGNPRRP
jgi:NarL family two-component system response regulator LiaR